MYKKKSNAHLWQQTYPQMSTADYRQHQKCYFTVKLYEILAYVCCPFYQMFLKCFIFLNFKIRQEHVSSAVKMDFRNLGSKPPHFASQSHCLAGVSSPLHWIWRCILERSRAAGVAGDGSILSELVDAFRYGSSLYLVIDLHSEPLPRGRLPPRIATPAFRRYRRGYRYLHTLSWIPHITWIRYLNAALSSLQKRGR